MGVSTKVAVFVFAHGVVAGGEADVFKLERQVLEFAPTRDDLTVGIAVFTALVPDEDWTVTLPEAERRNYHDRGSWKILELKPAGPNRFVLPSAKFEAAEGSRGPLCMSIKVWFNEITNRYDSPFYLNLPDRYALVSFCTKDDPRARARHSQNRVATLEKFKQRLKNPFVLKFKENRIRGEEKERRKSTDRLNLRRPIGCRHGGVLSFESSTWTGPSNPRRETGRRARGPRLDIRARQRVSFSLDACFNACLVGPVSGCPHAQPDFSFWGLFSSLGT